MGDCLFYFFPIALGYTCAKKLNVEPVLPVILAMLFAAFIQKPLSCS